MTDLFNNAWKTYGTVIVLGAAMFFFITLTAPVMTWVNTDSDSAIYLYAAKYLSPSHPTGAPAYNLLNAGLIRVFPFGDVAWRIALVSALASSATATILYHKTRHIIAPLVFMASGLVVSQSTIIETYALATLVMVVMWYWRNNWTVFLVAGIVGLGLHHIIGLTMIPILFTKWRNRESLKPALWLFLGVFWYAYIPLTNRPPYEDVWLRGNGIMDYINYMGSQAGLTLGLAVFSEDAIIRVQDASVLLVAGFSAALIPILIRTRNDLLTWVTWLPFFHYLLGLPHVAFVYAMPAFAFGGIMAVEGIEIMKGWTERVELKRLMPVMVAIPALFLVVVNFYAFDIGKSIDKEGTAQVFYQQLASVEPDAVVWTHHRGWELVVIRLYNGDNGTNIDYVLRAHNDLEDAKIAIARAHRDKRLYHTVSVDGSTYATEIEPTTPFDIWGNVLQQWYGASDIPESDRVRDWSNVGLDGDQYIATQ